MNASPPAGATFLQQLLMYLGSLNELNAALQAYRTEDARKAALCAHQHPNTHRESVPGLGPVTSPGMRGLAEAPAICVFCLLSMLRRAHIRLLICWGVCAFIADMRSFLRAFSAPSSQV
mmetsp:Transcript_5387/g.11916  ORF Transcript_5387/g.11916 Transcript_5387/m.11916 type:complete len:119 (-) Transcript_5387:469-825(-)